MPDFSTDLNPLSTSGRCCTPEYAWEWVNDVAEQGLDGSDNNRDILPTVIEHAMGLIRHLEGNEAELLRAWVEHCQPDHVPHGCRYCAKEFKDAVDAADKHLRKERHELTCVSCGPVTPRLTWKTMEGGRAHLGAYCRRCDRWIRWVPQVDKWLRAAPAKETVWRVTA